MPPERRVLPTCRNILPCRHIPLRKSGHRLPTATPPPLQIHRGRTGGIPSPGRRDCRCRLLRRRTLPAKLQHYLSLSPVVLGISRIGGMQAIPSLPPPLWRDRGMSHSGSRVLLGQEPRKQVVHQCTHCHRRCPSCRNLRHSFASRSHSRARLRLSPLCNHRLGKHLSLHHWLQRHSHLFVHRASCSEARVHCQLFRPSQPSRRICLRNYHEVVHEMCQPGSPAAMPTHVTNSPDSPRTSRRAQRLRLSLCCGRAARPAVLPIWFMATCPAAAMCSSLAAARGTRHRMAATI